MNDLLSLIVCTLGRRESLDRLLASLVQQRERRFETILVDQNREGYLAPVLARYHGTIEVRSPC